MKRIFFQLLMLMFVFPYHVLSQKKITAIDIEYSLPSGLSPGDNIRIKLYLVNNKNKRTEVKNQKYDLISAVTDGCEFNQGAFTINSDARSINNHRVAVTFSLTENPSITKTLSFDLDYRSTQKCSNCQGESGNMGASGKNGKTPILTCYGSDGEEGMYGGSGGNSPGGHVYLQAVFDSILQTTLLRVAVICAGSESSSYYLVNPAGGRLIISARGGSGGPGGAGGDGGDGKDAEKDAGLLKVDRGGCEGGKGGKGGSGGDGGFAGSLVIHIDPSAENYLSCITADVSAGSAGPGGNGGSGGKGGRGMTTAGELKYSLGNGEEWELDPGTDGGSGETGEKGKAGLANDVKKEYGPVKIPWTQ